MSKSNYITRITRLSVLPEKEPIFSELCTHITIVDEAGGEYLEITQQSGCPNMKEQTISLSADEWPAIKGAIEQLLAECRQ